MSSPKSSITPQRKHYKLLKQHSSGNSGGEVWPELVEQVFVEGLRAYWRSPWASYSTGRSRWRNQFLVEYLRSHDIIRTKKQVASHLQVLRNMWKGQPESNLLFGLEDKVYKTEDSPSCLSSFDDSDSVSPASSPNFSVSDITSSSTHSSPEYNAVHLTPEEYQQPFRQLNSTNFVTAFSLFADGMEPFTVRIDALPLPPIYTMPVVLKIRLCVPSVNDIFCPATLHGFSANLSLAALWNSSAKCTTKVFHQGVRASTETGALDVTSIELGSPHVVIPSSSLDRCRWIDPNIRATITQEIVVDNFTVLFVFYELVRQISQPAAQLLRFQRYHPGASPMAPMSPDSYFQLVNPSPQPAVKVELSEPTLTPQHYPFAATLSTDTSLSHALG
ncbi:hypothetical protein D9758_003309 [Tetrapyrgos nigripes]|uniref:TEA domain-containing protein n=1 Tax=Tetrapyrgos nigripes TaxID=182062 RepID=A0A8H5LQB9_9AGAR|nr:hypothetical protein D9758_003309 [Tetrapyrgos nigripes]